MSTHGLHLIHIWLVAAAFALTGCGGGGGGGNTAPVTLTPTTQNINKNGFYYTAPGGGIFGTATGSGTGSSNISMTDNITGDATVLQITLSNLSDPNFPAPASLRWFILQPNSKYTDESAYLTSGHLQFDIKLAVPSNSISSITLLGTSSPTLNSGVGQQTSSVTLNPSGYSTTMFTHVSIPLSTLYPPVSISKFVNVFFELRSTTTNPGSNVPTFYLNDIKWTSD